jgi:hypothetical protein
MSLIGCPLVVLMVLAADEPAPKFPLGKDTTYVTGPLDKDGYVDYEAALNDRLGKGITPENNANVLIWKALGPTPEGAHVPAEFFKRLGIDEPPKDGDYFISLSHFMPQGHKLDQSEFDVLYAQQSRASRRPWSAKDYPHIAEWLAANERPLAVVVEATRRPEYFNPLFTRSTEDNPRTLRGALHPGVQRCRDIAAALTARAMLRLREGKLDDAWQDLLTCHRLGRLLGRGGDSIEGIVGSVIDRLAIDSDLAYLERADLTATQIQDHLKDLQDLPPIPPLANKIDLCERFTHLQTVQFARRGGVEMLDALADGRPAPPKPDADGEKALAAIDWAPALRDGNRWFDRIVAAMRIMDRPDRQRELKRIEQDIVALNNRAREPARLAEILLGPPDKTVSNGIIQSFDDFIGGSIVAFRVLQDSHDRDEQVQRNEQIAFALAAYRRDHGDYPAKLDDLAPKYLPAVPDDLFSGGPLIYRPSDKGYLFYSIGVNGFDEGGRSRDDDRPGDDLPVSMPLPELKAKK